MIFHQMTYRHENILFIGSPGVGKTHLSIVLRLGCIKNEKSTYFIHCSELIEQLPKAAKDNKLEGKLRFLNRYAVLIIDEVGFIPFSPEAANYLFQLISRRYEKKSLIITTNKPISQWGEMFGDPALANALLDRLLHHSKVIKIPGRSYRTKDLVSELEERRRENYTPPTARNGNFLTAIIGTFYLAFNSIQFVANFLHRFGIDRQYIRIRKQMSELFDNPVFRSKCIPHDFFHCRVLFFGK
ncbi:ATP-binding protein [Ileibacterium valens]|uniref:ATP-binding protein n=1 Tax=Ileibacterium valens TaxID=1862668 RepID=UPI003F735726